MAAPTIAEQKPGWMTRIFGIESARLIACDAKLEGSSWERGERFTFLFRSRRGKFFVQTDAEKWTVVPQDEARSLYDRLVQVASATDAFAEPVYEPVPTSEEDEGNWVVVHNDRWEYSVIPDHLDAPGWKRLGAPRPKTQCLEDIERNYVFGAPPPAAK